MASLKKILIFGLSLGSYIYSCLVVAKFMFFLSTPKVTSKVYTWLFNLLDNKSRLETAYAPLVFDSIYIVLFILQHSLLKSDIFKNVLNKIGLHQAERTIYSLTSSLCLNYLMTNWIVAQSIVVWHVNIEKNHVLWWIFILIHIMAWVVIYGGSFIMDLPDIIGTRQAFYYLRNCKDPAKYKSDDLRRLYNHVRHPSFIGLSLVLWSTNIMTLDRLLLASMLTTYMYISWSTDQDDKIYHKYQLNLKKQELKSL